MARNPLSATMDGPVQLFLSLFLFLLYSFILPGHGRDRTATEACGRASRVLTTRTIKPGFPKWVFSNPKMNREEEKRMEGFFMHASPITKSGQVSTWQHVWNLCSIFVTLFSTLSLNPYLLISLRSYRFFLALCTIYFKVRIWEKNLARMVPSHKV